MQDVRKNIIVVFKTFHQSVLFTAIKQLTRGGIVDTVHNAFADLLTIYYISEEKYRSTCDCKLNLCNVCMEYLKICLSKLSRKHLLWSCHKNVHNEEMVSFIVDEGQLRDITINEDIPLLPFIKIRKMHSCRV